MKPILKEWKIDDHLKTPEERRAFLEAALEENDPEFFAIALGDIARAEGISRVAQRSKIRRENLYRAFSKGGNPTITTIMKALRALNMRLTIAPCS